MIKKLKIKYRQMLIKIPNFALYIIKFGFSDVN